MSELPPPEYVQGSLRTRLVSKLTGLTPPTLQHWHQTMLQSATQEPGDRGTPRLYSWVDYQRLCVMAALKSQGIPATRIRQAIPFLDKMFPKWWELSLRAYSGKVPGSFARKHIALRVGNFDIISDVPGAQTTFRELLGEDVTRVAKGMEEALNELACRGPLFAKRDFSDAVSMSPELNAAQPTIIGTGLETEFVARMAAAIGRTETARIYRLDDWLVQRAIEFEAAA